MDDRLDQVRVTGRSVLGTHGSPATGDGAYCGLRNRTRACETTAGKQFPDEISQFLPLVLIGASSTAFYPAKLYTPLAARL
jgi:hypothetical protein